MADLFNETVLEKAWQEHGDAIKQKMKQAGIVQAKAFDHKAKAFNEQSFGEEGRNRSARIVNWLESRGVTIQNASILDIGAASGVFTVPFVERGAKVTALESSVPLVELLQKNTAAYTENEVSVVSEAFEEIDVSDKGWKQAFDLVFVSMCPVIYNWEDVEKVLSCAKQFCYISMPVGGLENSLLDEIWPIVTGKQYHKSLHLDMGYLLHLLYLKGYSYETLITKESKTMELSTEAAVQEMISLMNNHKIEVDNQQKKLIAAYIEQAFPSGNVIIQQGGRFGKVLIRLQDQNMYVQ